MVNDWKSCGGMVAGKRELELREVGVGFRDPEGGSELGNREAG